MLRRLYAMSLGTCSFYVPIAETVLRSKDCSFKDNPIHCFDIERREGDKSRKEDEGMTIWNKIILCWTLMGLVSISLIKASL
jgi:hypothetical protein